MQASSDIFLGWVRIEAGDRRQGARLLRAPAEGLEGLGGNRADGSPRVLAAYGRLCGWTLARAHARSGDPIAIAAYLGKGPVFDHAIVSSRVPTRSRTSATTQR